MVCEVWVVKPRFYKDEVFKVGGRMDIRGVYRVSSLMKQNKKGKNYAVFCFAGKRKLLFIYYAVITWEIFYKRATIYYLCVCVCVCVCVILYNINTILKIYIAPVERRVLCSIS